MENESRVADGRQSTLLTTVLSSSAMRRAIGSVVKRRIQSIPDEININKVRLEMNIILIHKREILIVLFLYKYNLLYLPAYILFFFLSLSSPFLLYYLIKSKVPNM